MRIEVSDGARVLDRATPVPTGVNEESSAPTRLWIVPPVQVGVAAVHTPPVPVTTSPPLPAAVPVLLSTIPFAGSAAAVLLPEDTLWNVMLPEPIVVFATFRPGALTESIVLPVPATVTVPPPVALKPVAGGRVDVEPAAA